jgi:hypothetical protein
LTVITDEVARPVIERFEMLALVAQIFIVETLETTREVELIPITVMKEADT